MNQPRDYPDAVLACTLSGQYTAGVNVKWEIWYSESTGAIITHTYMSQLSPWRYIPNTFFSIDPAVSARSVNLSSILATIFPREDIDPRCPAELLSAPISHMWSESIRIHFQCDRCGRCHNPDTICMPSQ